MDDAIKQETLADLSADFTELLWLAETGLMRLRKFRDGWLGEGSPVREEIRRALVMLLDPIEQSYLQVSGELRLASTRLSSCSAEEIPTIIEMKKRTQDILRSLQGITASVLASTDWQSPSYLHAVQSQAGRQTGKIKGTVNDYKRDQHLDAEAYENTFLREYVDVPLRFSPNICACSSGMAAFTTILDALILGGKITGPVLMGASCYFENKGLLEKAFRGNIHTVDEFDTNGIIEAAKRFQPSAIFLDTICNTDTLAMPDLATLIPALAKGVKKETYLVLDNSGLAVSCQPFPHLPALSHKLRLVVFESLNKYHQFGMDRITGGMVWADAMAQISLFGYRMHLGTNMPDASVLSMPEPNRELLAKRLQRFERNAMWLATRLDEVIKQSPHSLFSHVVYPGLSSYDGYSWTSARSFHGGSMVLAPKPGRDRPSLSTRFIERVIALSREQGVDLVAGTSFGLNTTRLYLTALHATKITRPFLRISVGTETRMEMEAIADVITDVLRH